MRSFSKLSVLSLAILIAVLPFGIWAAIQLPIGSAGVHEWLPEGRIERMRYEDFTRRFGSDQVLLVSWQGAQLGDPKLEAFTQAIESHPEFHRFFGKLVSPHSIVDRMVSPPWRLEQDKASQRLRGVLIGDDGTVAMLLTVTDFGVANHRQTIELLRSIADSVPSLGRDPLRLVGTVYESYAVDEAAEASLTRLVLPSSLIGLLMCWLCLGRLRAVWVVMLLAGLGQLLMVAMVYYSGYQFSAVLIVLPTLVFMLTLSGAVHLMNYFLEQQVPGGKPSGVLAVAKGWWPCILSSATTALGMGSLLTSQLFPVRQFGVFAALGLTTATLMLVFTFPALADLFFGLWNRRAGIDPLAKKPTHVWISLSFGTIQRYVRWQSRHSPSIVLVSFLVFVATATGLLWLRSSTKFCDMFPTGHRTHQDMLWFEEHIGPISTVEVLLHFSHSQGSDILDQVRQVGNVARDLKAHEDVGGVLSATAFLPNVSESSGIRAAAQRSVLRRRVEDSLQQFVSDGLLFHSDEENVWRVAAKVSAVSDRSYGEVTHSITQWVERALLDAKSTASPVTKIEVTGLSPVMHETQLALLSDLGYSFLSAFLLITPVMIWVVRSVAGGLLIMLPNVLPVTLAFGCMGWFGWSLDIAGILTASVALGIAVDDTLHFVCWYMNELKSGHSRIEAIERTLIGCCRAMIQTTLISCSAMLPFLFAEFVPTQQFAKLMIVMLTSALFADLIVLPAILLSPLGKFIGKSPVHSTRKEFA